MDHTASRLLHWRTARHKLWSKSYIDRNQTFLTCQDMATEWVERVPGIAYQPSLCRYIHRSTTSGGDESSVVALSSDVQWLMRCTSDLSEPWWRNIGRSSSSPRNTLIEHNAVSHLTTGHLYSSAAGEDLNSYEEPWPRSW